MIHFDVSTFIFQNNSETARNHLENASELEY